MARTRPTSRKSRASAPPSTWRRALRVGPGLVLAAVASVFVLQRSPLQQSPVPASRPPEELPKYFGSPAPSAPVESAPDPQWLLTQRAVLSLSAAQSRRLQVLVSHWERDTQPLRAELARAQSRFEREMAQDKGRGVSLQVLRERAAPVTELSARMAAARGAWWGEASQVLGAAQRERARDLWQVRLNRRRA